MQLEFRNWKLGVDGREEVKMHNDDRPIGRALSRREALALFSATATASFAHGVHAHEGEDTAASFPLADCVAEPEQTEGPYFVDEALERSDIRRDPTSGTICAGAPLVLQFVLSRVTPTGACALLPGAQVDIWHCDARGVFSDVEDRYSNTRGEKFLRGYQISDERGVVRFTTTCCRSSRRRRVTRTTYRIAMPGVSRVISFGGRRGGCDEARVTLGYGGPAVAPPLLPASLQNPQVSGGTPRTKP